MLNQNRVDGLLHYMEEIGLCQMVFFLFFFIMHLRF